MCSLSCVRAHLISVTVLSPAVCACWAPPASHSNGQRYLRIPADKTIICSASPWFRASGCVWCLPLVSWLEKDGRFEIPLAPFVYFLPYRPTVYPDGPLFSNCIFLLYGLQQLENKVSAAVPSSAATHMWWWLVSRVQKATLTEGTCGKMFKLDTYTVEPEQGEQKRTLRDEVIVLVELKWQITNTFRSILDRRKDILPENPNGLKAWLKFEQQV